jgi:hypothetical protein
LAPNQDYSNSRTVSGASVTPPIRLRRPANGASYAQLDDQERMSATKTRAPQTARSAHALFDLAGSHGLPRIRPSLRPRVTILLAAVKYVDLPQSLFADVVREHFPSRCKDSLFQLQIEDAIDLLIDCYLYNFRDR